MEVSQPPLTTLPAEHVAVTTFVVGHVAESDAVVRLMVADPAGPVGPMGPMGPCIP